MIPICRGHHWTLVIVRTHPHISLMILDSLNKEHRSVELKITRYLQDVWSAKLPQRAKKTLEVKQIRYPTTPPQPNNTDCGLYIMKCFEKFLDFVNRNLQWSSWNPEFSHKEVISFRKEIKHAILDEISTKKTNEMMQSCVHAPKCNSEVDRNTFQFVICQGLNFLTKITKIKTFVRHGQTKSRD